MNIKSLNFVDIVKSYLTIIFFAIFCLVMSLLEPRFLALSNILNVFRQTSVNALIASGMTLVILSGGIDLSVGSIFALSATLGAMSMVAGLGSGVSFFVTVLVGALFGMVNGILVAVLKMQAFIATLITMTFARGLTYIISSGVPITMSSGLNGMQFYSFIGGGYILGLPTPVVITLLLYAFLFWLLSQTRFGRYTYAIGDNEKTAILAGVKTVPVKVSLYIICGMTASLGALVLTSRLGSAPPTSGMGYELDAIAAVVLGGTSLSGGKGSIMKTLLGALIISVLANALNLLSVSAYYQMLVKALVILLAVLGQKK